MKSLAAPRRLLPVGVALLTALASAQTDPPPKAEASTPLVVQEAPAPEASTAAGLFLWRIDTSVPSYVFGTVHLWNPELATLPPELVTALQRSEILYAERPLDQDSRLEGTRMLLMEDVAPLRHRLPLETYEALDVYMRSKERSLAQIERLHLWAIALQITTMHGTRRPNAGRPQDEMLWNLADEMGLRRDALESVEEQLAPFTRLTPEDCREFVKAALEAASQIEAAGTTPGQTLLRLYLQGNEHNLASHAQQFMPGDERLRAHLIDALIKVRNRRMALRIYDKIRTHRTTPHVFAIGAGHLGGADGVIELLRARGLRMTRILPGGATQPVQPFPKKKAEDDTDDERDGAPSNPR